MNKKGLLALILFTTSNVANAAAISFTDRTAFETAVGPFLFENFDSFPGGAGVVSLFGGLVNFPSPSPSVFYGNWTASGTVAPGPVEGGALLPEPYNPPIYAPPLQIEFSTPVFAIGADLFDDFDGLHTLSLLVETNEGNTYQISETSNQPQAGFLGFLSLEGIIAAQFFDDSNNVIEVDNLTVSVSGLSEVPVPAAFWLFATALVGLVGFSKRRKVA